MFELSGNILSGIVASIVAFSSAIWKIFSLSRDIAVLAMKIHKLEDDFKSISSELIRTEEKLTAYLNRIEAKLDSFILRG